jgi:hypothetical protein
MRRIKTTRFYVTIKVLSALQVGAICLKFIDGILIPWGIIFIPVYLMFLVTIGILAKLVVAMAKTIEANDMYNEIKKNESDQEV